jgi:hypothetical protein
VPALPSMCGNSPKQAHGSAAGDGARVPMFCQPRALQLPGQL